MIYSFAFKIHIVISSITLLAGIACIALSVQGLIRKRDYGRGDWAIEHIALMIFALFLTQLGRAFIKKSKGSFRKFRASLFYFGASLLLILFSMTMALTR